MRGNLFEGLKSARVIRFFSFAILFSLKGEGLTSDYEGCASSLGIVLRSIFQNPRALLRESFSNDPGLRLVCFEEEVSFGLRWAYQDYRFVFEWKGI